MQIHTLDLNFSGRHATIAAYLVVGAGGPVLVETGPASTLETLVARLAELGFAPADVRHVLVTHIHLDHAGAAGWWAQQGATVYVHPIGAPHLVDPSRLLTSAGRIYGDAMDVLWGHTLPAPAERVRAVRDGETVQVNGLTFTALDTPGHAWHHHVYRLGDAAFTGDAAGVRLPGSDLGSIPAPPPEFDREAWRKTLQRLSDENFAALYLTHFGPVRDARQHLEQMRELLEEVTEFVGQRVQNGRERDDLVAEYSTWNRQRAQAHGVTEPDWQRHELANPLFMSVDGVTRYWRKHNPF